MFSRINRAVTDRRNGLTSDKGFTLIELLVVVIIIGILAAIAIPMFLSQRENAWGAAVESDMKNATIAAESFATNHNGKYADATSTLVGVAVGTAGTAWGDNGFNPSADVTVTFALKAGSDTKYTLVGTHSETVAKRHWTYDSEAGVIEMIDAAP